MTATDSPIERIGQWQRRSLQVGIGATLLAITGFILDREQFLRSYLFGYLYWLGMAVGCLGILLMHHTVGGKWGMMIRRMCEAGARTLPYMIILLIPVLLNLPTLYPWARPEAAHDANLVAKSAYLNIPGVVIRTILYFAVWALYAYLMSKWSSEQDRTGEERFTNKNAPGQCSPGWWSLPS